MSEGLQVRAEILKLARLLGRDPAGLQYLESVPPDDLRQLREQATDVLFNAHGTVLARLAAASRLLPVGLAATIGERAFGPVLCARLTGMLEPGRALELAGKLPSNFLADVAIELDPRRASAVIGQIPPRQIGEITRELVRRGEYVTMGRFVGHLSEPSIAAAVDELDDRSLLHVAFVLESKDRLETLVGLLSLERLEGIVKTAASDGLWPAVLDLLSNLSERRRAELADIAADQDDGVLDSLVAAAQAQQIWDAVLPLTRSMSQRSTERFAVLTSIHADGVLELIVRAAAGHQLWTELLPLVPLLPDGSRERVVRVAAALELDEVAVKSFAAAVIENELWDAGSMLLTMLDQSGQQQLVVQFGKLDPGEREQIASRAESAGVLDQLGPLRAALTAPAR